jgi:hypothetical protein
LLKAGEQLEVRSVNEVTFVDVTLWGRAEARRPFGGGFQFMPL